MYLYPRLTFNASKEIARSKATQDPIELRQSHGNGSEIDPSALFAPTGGHRADAERLKNLRRNIRALADENGFPSPPSVAARSNFDNQAGVLLFEQMDIAPSEASSLGVWMHMTCTLLPDIVRWRFSGEATTEDRFIGGPRGLRRNTFGRLWWRTFLLCEPGWGKDQYFLLEHFGEDDLVQITERPSLAGSSRLARQILISYLETLQVLDQDTGRGEISDRRLMRDVVKRVRRLLPLIMFDALEPSILKNTIDGLFLRSIEQLQRI